MMERREPGDGFRVLDGVALVMGAAVASVHIRSALRAGPGWVLLWGSFCWVALTATGPFLLALRRFARPQPDYPGVGDQLWALLGLPWVLTALFRAAAPDDDPMRDPLIAASLSVGLAVVSLLAVSVVWSTWVVVPPEQAAQTASTPWTNRVGLILAIAWPVQCGIGLIVTG